MRARETPLLLALTALLAAMALACGGGNSASSTVPGSFHLEATTEVTQRTGDPLVSQIVWWFEPPGRWRWEIANALRVTTGVSDGEHWWFYRSDEHAYTIRQAPAGASPAFLPVSLFVGPMPQANVDEFVDLLAARVGWADSVGEERLLGRDVTVIEYGVGGDTDHEARERAEGSARVWIDPQTMFVLRHEITGEQDATLTVTLLELDVDVPDDLFEFEPPEGATRLEE